MTKWPTHNSAYFAIGRLGALVLTPDRKPRVQMTSGTVTVRPCNDNGPDRVTAPGECAR